VLERAKTVRALDRSTTAIGNIANEGKQQLGCAGGKRSSSKGNGGRHRRIPAAVEVMHSNEVEVKV
jgi:hypothetical protein